MCTLTVVTGNDTYLMAMNRDEIITRGTGLPPAIHEFDGTRAIYPNDGDDGTWFATNEYGVAFALLNWNDIAPHAIVAKTQSRGRVIPALIDSRSLSDLREVIGVSNFKGMMPFRLAGVFQPTGRFGSGVGTRYNLISRFMRGNHGTGFHRASRTSRPKACAGRHVAAHSMNQMLAPCPGSEDFTHRTPVVRGHSACAYIGRT